MNDLILQLSSNYFVKQVTPNRLNILATHSKQLRDIEDTYDSLILVYRCTLQSGVLGVFQYRGLKCSACDEYNYSHGDGCIDCSFDASVVDIY